VRQLEKVASLVVSKLLCPTQALLRTTQWPPTAAMERCSHGAQIFINWPGSSKWSRRRDKVDVNRRMYVMKRLPAIGHMQRHLGWPIWLTA